MFGSLSDTGGAGVSSGLLLALATSQIGLGPLAFGALVPVLWLVDRGASPRRAALAGWIAGVILFGVALAWVPLAGLRGLVLAFTIAYVAVIATSLAAFAAAAAWLRRRDRALFLLATPLLWVLCEYARSRGALGYPWHQLGYALAAYPSAIQLAAFGGLYALSLWIAAANATLVSLRGASLQRIAVSAALLATPLALGLRMTPPDRAADTLRVAAVQPAVTVPGRGHDATFDTNLRHLLRLTDQALAERPDLVVWPESAYERPVRDGAAPLLGAIVRAQGTPLLTGVWRLDRATPPDLYNSAVLVDALGEIAVAGDKVHPVPFYEGTPQSAFEQVLASFGLWRGQFRPGARAGLAELRRPDRSAVQLGVLVCLDSSYPELARDLQARGAELLVEISNEAQTGAWSAVQHAHVTRMRAVETGLPLVRVGNFGPSEWVDRFGRVRFRSEVSSRLAATQTIHLDAAPPPYTRLGDAPALLAGLLPLMTLTARRRQRNLLEPEKRT